MRKILNFSVILVLLLIYTKSLKAQNPPYVDLTGKQFYNSDGDPFFPMVMNYTVDLVHNGVTLSDPLIANEIKFVRSHDYGTEKWDFENYSWTDCQNSVEHDFVKIKEMGFNSIRLILDLRKNEGVVGFHASIADFTNFHYSTSTFLDAGTQYTDQNSDVIFQKIADIIDLAADNELYVILLCSDPPEDPFATDRGSSLAEATDYGIYLNALAIQLESKTHLLAYDIYNEPNFQIWDRNVVQDKSAICQFVDIWCDEIRSADTIHLITIGGTDAGDVHFWDESIMKIDFLSMHFYPYLKEWENYDPEPAIKRVLNQIYWCTHALQRPWIIGETGFLASEFTCFSAPTIDGTLQNQKEYVEQVLVALRDCGASGFSWWEFMDERGYCWDTSDPCASANNPPCWICGLFEDGYKSEYNRGAFYGLLNYVDSDPTNSLASTGHYVNSNADKPAIDAVRLFDASNINLCNLPTSTNEYYNPYNHPNHPNAQIGLVIDDETGESIENAFVMGFTIVGKKSNGQPINYQHYTYSDANGDFTLIPFDIELNNEPDGSNLQINQIRLSAAGAEYIGISAFPPVSSNVFNLKRDFFEYDPIIDNLIVNTGEQKLLRAYHKLTIKDNVQFKDGSSGTLTAREEIRLDHEFHAKTGSEVHIFTSVVEPECGDFSGYRVSSTGSENFTVPQISNKEIEIHFNQNQTNLLFEVSPNPNQGRFVIKSTSLEYNGSIIKVYNSLGKIIYQTIGNNNLNELDLSNQPKAVYYLTLQSKNEIKSSKIIVQ